MPCGGQLRATSAELPAVAVTAGAGAVDPAPVRIRPHDLLLGRGELLSPLPVPRSAATTSRQPRMSPLRVTPVLVTRSSAECVGRVVSVGGAVVATEASWVGESPACG